MNRAKVIIRTSLLGIITNIVLVIFKMTVGLIAGSIAIVLDAVNNLTDVCSSVVTIIGAKLAGRTPDPEHPYGHGRFEYLAAMAVGVIVLLAGIMALIESAPKVFQSELADYSAATVIVVTAGVIVKLLLGRHVKKVGQKVDSGSLIASGIDAIFDALLSFSTLVGIFVTMIFQISIDGILGVIIAAFIIKTSIEILTEAAADILGRGIDPDLAHEIRETVRSFAGVQGAYDLDLHNYGPAEYIGSVHIEVPDQMTAREIDQLSRKITRKIYQKYAVALTIGIYTENNDTEMRREVRKYLQKIVAEHAEIRQMHGLHIDEETKTVCFDLIIDQRCSEKSKLKNHIVRHLKKTYPDFRYHVTLDLDRENHDAMQNQRSNLGGISV